MVALFLIVLIVPMALIIWLTCRAIDSKRRKNSYCDSCGSHYRRENIHYTCIDTKSYYNTDENKETTHYTYSVRCICPNCGKAKIFKAYTENSEDVIAHEFDRDIISQPLPTSAKPKPVSVTPANANTYSYCKHCGAQFALGDISLKYIGQPVDSANRPRYGYSVYYAKATCHACSSESEQFKIESSDANIIEDGVSRRKTEKDVIREHFHVTD